MPDGAEMIMPNTSTRKSFQDKARRHWKAFTTRLPIMLAVLLGLQHTLAMLAGVITAPIILAGAANLDLKDTQYPVSTSLIVSGIFSRFHIYKTCYYLGTELISVVGTSFSIIPVAFGTLTQTYKIGYCPSNDDGSLLPCPDGYGTIIGTARLCALFEIILSLMTRKMLTALFPPLVTGPTSTLVGVSLIKSGFQACGGGSGACFSRPTSGDHMLCSYNKAPHALPWGSAEFICLGFAVFVTIIICERFGSPLMKSSSVIIGLFLRLVYSYRAYVMSLIRKPLCMIENEHGNGHGQTSKVESITSTAVFQGETSLASRDYYKVCF
ncbi:hypothetical protein VTL71DRAFT_15009 [Oculimacula yallundae]|uniref:Uncharacterized protein n=1 Tax=Oculimacula yallundae TaxID=86028 RepID=A0ABR4CHD9_9HELO